MKETLEARIAKAAEAICPIFFRPQFKQSYIPFNIPIEKLDHTKAAQFAFSNTFNSLYNQLKKDLLLQKLILEF